MPSSSEISKIVELVLNQSIVDQASDILFKPKQGGYQISIKVKGELAVLTHVAASGTTMAANFVKELAGLDPKNIYTSQDGCFVYEGYLGELTKFRVITDPSSKGETICVRVIPQPY